MSAPHLTVCWLGNSWLDGWQANWSRGSGAEEGDCGGAVQPPEGYVATTYCIYLVIVRWYLNVDVLCTAVCCATHR